MATKERPAQSNQSLEHGIRCLLRLAAADAPVGCRELARELGFEPTKVSRLLGTLAHMGLAAQTPGKKYMPGSGLNVLAALSLRGSRLLKIALPHVGRLAAKLQRGVSLGVLWETQICYLYHGHGTAGALATINGHELYPAEKSSIGLALLAVQTTAEIKALFPGNRELLKTLAAVRKQGYAVGDQNSIAVGIGGTLQLGGIAINHFDSARDDLTAIVAALRESDAAITAEWQA